ncbi:DUF2924 domain-containing protein [Nioella sp.]|uniref:DUF2924 domain-containing protein n=1 Tax=Nioella sp. TaxID=1912091 RepID=UPI003A8AFC1D
MKAAGALSRWSSPFAQHHAETRLCIALPFHISFIANIARKRPELKRGKTTRRMLDLLADEVDGTLTRKSQIADPRNPVVGTKLIREWDGVAHTVTVLKDGFEWDGRRYKSLSAVARAITGTRWNGYRFFGLRERKRGEP